MRRTVRCTLLRSGFSDPTGAVGVASLPREPEATEEWFATGSSSHRHSFEKGRTDAIIDTADVFPKGKSRVILAGRGRC